MIIRTPMLTRYLAKFAFRILVFFICLYLYLFHKDQVMAFLMKPISMGLSPIYVLWAIFMGLMIIHIFPDIAKIIPNNRLTMGLLKMREQEFQKAEGYSEYELLKFVQGMNLKAWQVMLVWLVFNGFWGILYLLGIIGDADLFMLTVFYFLSDYICILLFCPFQTFIMKNKCCVNCRIYDWGHFMMFTPMLFIRSFFSWSLFFTSCVVLLHWELTYAKHPERFWYGSNRILQCSNCKDKTCQIKKKIAGVAGK